MKLHGIAALALSLAVVTGCSKPDQRLLDAQEISYDQISASSGSAKGLEQTLTDTTHVVPLINGSLYRYLAPNGRAYVKSPADEQATQAEWRVVSTPNGTSYLCLAPGKLPAGINPVGHPDCTSRSDLLGHAFFFRKGDPLGLAASAKG